MIKRIVCGIIVMAPACALADTVYFKDGRVIDGETSQPNPNAISITMGQSQITFPMSDVDRVEENDKTSEGYDLAKISPMAVQHMRAMEEEFGVNQEQRERLIKLVEGLRTDDANEQQAIMGQLQVLAGQMNVMQFLKASVGSFNKYIAPKVLESMVQIDPEEATPALREHTADMIPDNRAKALELLAKVGDAESLELVARGMKDHETMVQISAANAMADLADKRATPALIEGLSSTDDRVANASRNALSRIWGSAETPVDFQSAEEWQTYWNGRQGEVQDPVRLANLDPLYTPDENMDPHYQFLE